MKKIFGVILTFFTLGLYAFEWPQSQQTTPDLFSSCFGQLRGGNISNSLVFSDETEIKATDNGFVAVIICDYLDESVFFPSTLGNAAIIAHQDNLLTVYANIEGQTISEEIKKSTNITMGTVLGNCGNSAWHQGKDTLEFQVIDSKNNTAINPRILMPRINGKELPLYISGLTLQNRTGRFYKASEQSTLPAGFYRAYYRRQSITVPYKTHLALNGTVVDEISFDLLRQDGNYICASGKKNYPKTILYPNDELVLIGEVIFTPGKNSLQCAVSDILGKETVATYYITNY